MHRKSMEQSCISKASVPNSMRHSYKKHPCGSNNKEQVLGVKSIFLFLHPWLARKKTSHLQDLHFPNQRKQGNVSIRRAIQMGEHQVNRKTTRRSASLDPKEGQKPSNREIKKILQTSQSLKGCTKQKLEKPKSLVSNRSRAFKTQWPKNSNQPNPTQPIWVELGNKCRFGSYKWTLQHWGWVGL